MSGNNIFTGHFEYLEVENFKLFTVVLLPQQGKFPTVIIRDPYVGRFENTDEYKVVFDYLFEYYDFSASRKLQKLPIIQ